MASVVAASQLDYSRHVLVEAGDLLARLRQLTMTSVEHAADQAALERLIECVTQAHRTFTLIECYGAELLCSEYLSLLQAVQAGTVDAGFDTAPVMVLAGEKLTEYIDYLKSGGPDLPLALLPLVNNMRACFGATLLSESLIVAPHFSVPEALPALHDEHASVSAEVIEQHRLSMMKKLLQWYENPHSDTATALASEFGSLRGICPANELADLFAVAEGLMLSLADEGLAASTAIKLLLGQLERFIYTLSQQVSLLERGPASLPDGEAAGQGDGGSFPAALYRNLLYYLALSESADDRVATLKTRFRLNELLPPKISLEHARSALGGPGASLSDAICNSVAKELTAVRSTLENCTSWASSELKDARHQLQQISYTLLLLDLPDARRLNLRAINRIGLAEKTGDLSLLMAVASDVLQVFAALDEFQHSKRPATVFADEFSDENAVNTGKLSTYQFRCIAEKCLAEAVLSIRSAQVEFLAVHESPPRRHQLTAVARRLRGVASALQILPLPEVRPLLEGAADYLQHLEGSEVSPTADVYAAFASLLVCIEFYLDPVLQKQAAAAQLLTQADAALDELQSADENYFRNDSSLAPAPVSIATPDVHDSDTLSVFIGESLESLGSINKSLTDWKRDALARHLSDLRQHYHLLGERGGVTGARTLAHLCAANEKLLDSVISGKLNDPDGAVMLRADAAADLNHLLEDSVGMLPQLLNQLPAQGEHLQGLDTLLQRLDAAVDVDVVESAEHAAVISDAGFDTAAVADAETVLETDPLATRVDEQNSAAWLETGIANDEIFDTAILAASADTEINDFDWLEETVVINVPAGVVGETANEFDTTCVVNIARQVPLPEIPVSADALDDTTDLSLEATQIITSELTGDSVGSESLDNTLLQVFFSECRSHFGLLKEEIGDAFADARFHLPTAVMQRSLHTLHGSAQTADVQPVVELVAPLVDLAHRRLAASRRLNRGETELVSDTVRSMERAVDALATGALLPDFDSVRAQLDTLLRAERDTDATTSATADLQELFIEEAGDLLAKVHNSITSLRDADEHRSPLAEIAASLHTLKGSARVARFNAIADLTHALEGAIQRWMGKLPLSAEHQDLLQQVVDAITLNLEQARSGKALGQFDWLIAELDEGQAPRQSLQAQFLSGDAGKRAAPDSSSVMEVDDTMVISTPYTRWQTPVVEAAVSSAALSEPEQIRLDTASISRLSDLSTEASIHHARVSGHLHALRHTLVDLDKTTDRLRYQLRELQQQADFPLPGQDYSLDVASSDNNDSSADRDATLRLDPLALEHDMQSREDARLMAEVLEDFDVIRRTLQSQLAAVGDDAAACARLDTDIQQSLLRSRLVRFGQHVDRLGSVVRQTASALNKQVDWRLLGGQLEIERGLHKALAGPLEHLVRNAITHGIESREEREQRGKPQVGMVTLSVAFVGTELVVQVIDDGGGVDLAAIRKQLGAEGGQLSDQALLDRLFDAGLSSLAQANDYAGRGLGLDAVSRAIAQLDGKVTISSASGKGTTVTIRLPLRVVINQVVLVDVGDVTYGLPVNHVHTVQAVTGEVASFNGTEYATRSLPALLGIPATTHTSSLSSQAVLVAAGGETVALQVGDVAGYRELIAHPLGPQLSSLGLYSGGGILPDGRSVLILDLDVLLSGSVSVSQPDAGATAATVQPTQILVVDDSVTMREYAGEMLVRQGCEVTYARDGIEALECLSRLTPDLVLLDIEMPGMSGFDLLTNLRAEDQYRDLPVIMITSRSASRHRQRAGELNAQGYIVKPWREAELLHLLQKCIDTTR